MKGIHPNPLTSADLRENLRGTNEVLDELYLRPAFLPGQGGVAAGAAFVRTIPRAPSVEFPAAGTPAWEVVLLRRSRWQQSSVRVTTHYSATVGSTNNFVWHLRIWNARPGDVLDATAASLDVKMVIPGPAVAKTYLQAVYVSPIASSFALPGNATLQQFQFFRDKTDADDTNANSLHVVAVTYEVLTA